LAIAQNPKKALCLTSTKANASIAPQLRIASAVMVLSPDPIEPAMHVGNGGTDLS